MDYADRATLTAGNGRLTCGLAPWDEEVFGFPVAAILSIEAEAGTLPSLLDQYSEWCAHRDIAFSSIRLPLESVAEIQALESADFRLVEIAMHPEQVLTSTGAPELPGVAVRGPRQGDLDALRSIAATAFSYQRFHLDPAFPTRLADLRYGRWVERSWEDPNQQFFVLDVEGQVTGFWICENQQEQTATLELAAIAAAYQGKGLGTHLWTAASALLARQGVRLLRTTISLTNTRVLNLYGKLGWKLGQAHATLHQWRRPGLDARCAA